MKRMLEAWRRLPGLRWVVMIAFTALAVFLALRNVRLEQVGQILSQSRGGVVLLSLASVMATHLAKTARWRALIGPQGDRVADRRLFMSIMTGQLFNIFLPGRVGDLSRAYEIGGLGPGRAFILGTVALEKVIEMISFALLFLLTLLALPLPGWIRDSGLTFTLLALILAAGLALLVRYPAFILRLACSASGWLAEPLRAGLLARLQAGLSSLQIVQQPRSLAWIALWTAVVWASGVWTNVLVLQALDLPASWLAGSVILLVLQIGVSIPSVPGRVGVFQYLCILTLGLFGIDQAAGLSYGILLQAVAFLPTVVLGLLFLWMGGAGDRPAPVESGEERPAPRAER
jgi:hypothetical protein